MQAFFGCDRNYIILTNSGKPVFAQHGDMYTLSSIYATLYAMISKVQTYRFLERITEESADTAFSSTNATDSDLDSGHKS